MKPEELSGSLALMAQQCGLQACALVDSSTGLIWHAYGDAPEGASAWEAATEYWRLYGRQQRNFAGFGPLRAVLLHHQQGLLAVLPCSQEPPLLVVAYGGHRQADWQSCQRAVRAIGALISKPRPAPEATAAASS